MTPLEKDVSRKCELLLDHRMAARTRDKYIVTLTAEKTIKFRPHGRRKTFELPLAVVLMHAFLADTNDEKRRKKEARKAQKNGSTT